MVHRRLAEKWGCRCVGIELNPQRATAARERVRNLGLAHLITITEGDAGTVPVSGDVAVVYLYPDVLARLKPRLEHFRAVASYLHQPPMAASEEWGYVDLSAAGSGGSVAARGCLAGNGLRSAALHVGQLCHVQFNSAATWIQVAAHENDSCCFGICSTAAFRQCRIIVLSSYSVLGLLLIRSSWLFLRRQLGR